MGNISSSSCFRSYCAVSTANTEKLVEMEAIIPDYMKNAEDLIAKLAAFPDIRNLKVGNKKTLLHIAVSQPDFKLAESLVYCLLEAEWNSYPENAKKYSKEFINAITLDGKEDTPLHLAAKNFSEGAAEKLLNAGAHVQLKNSQGLSVMTLLYATLPQVLKSLYDKSVSLEPGFDFTELDSRLTIDFAPITGLTTKLHGSSEIESELIYVAIDNPLKRRKEILSHVLVRLFLELKWQKLSLINYVSILLHMVWHFLFVLFGMMVFLNGCSINEFTASPAALPVAHASNSSETCNYDAVGLGLNIASFSFNMVIAGFEVIEFYSQSPRSSRTRVDYLKNIENILQIIMIALNTITCVFLWFSNLQLWLYYLITVGLSLTGVLVTLQFGNIPWLVPLVRELRRVGMRAICVTIVFLPIIIGFSCAFMVFFAGEAPHFVNLGTSFAKVFAMSTGEITFDELGGTGSGLKLPWLYRSLILLFIVFSVLTLYNYIVSYSFSTITELHATAEVDKMVDKLKKIHTMESLLHGIKTRCCKTPSSAGDPEIQVGKDGGHTYKLRDIPEKLREELIQLGRKNRNRQ